MEKRNYRIIKEKEIEYLNRSICSLRKHNLELNILLTRLEMCGEVILIGGAIRDVCHCYLPRDFDFIVKTKQEHLDIFLSNYPAKKNRFGGYKVNLDSVEIDIWTMESHWPFKEGFFECKEDNISKSVFFNLDALVYNLSTGHYNVEHYNEAIEKNELSIMYSEEDMFLNPQPEQNIVKAILLNEKCKINISDSTKVFIEETLNEDKDIYDKMKIAQEKHYGFIAMPIHLLKRKISNLLSQNKSIRYEKGRFITVKTTRM